MAPPPAVSENSIRESEMDKIQHFTQIVMLIVAFVTKKKFYIGKKWKLEVNLVSGLQLSRQH